MIVFFERKFPTLKLLLAVILISIGQPAFAQSTSIPNSISFIPIFQPIDVTADSNYIFVIHNTCSLGKNYQHGIGSESYCPGFTSMYCFGNYQSEVLSIDKSGEENVIASLPSPFDCYQKDHIAIASGLGGFQKDRLYIAQGSWSGTNIWSTNIHGSGMTLFKADNHPLGSDVHITFDTTGTFGYAMIISGGNEVWKITSEGKSSLLAEIPIRGHHGGEGIGGVAVAPLDFGQYGGDLLVPDSGTGNIFAISPNLTLQKITFKSGASEIIFVPPNTCTFGNRETTFLSSYASDNDGSVVMYPERDFAGLGGDALIADQYNPSLVILTSNNNTLTIKEFQSNIDTQFLEGSGFVQC
ncbi:MAG: hypothetical protein KGI25_05555 [Thaumarchaeota archaeon]|nr:hypothetical protein [Nitrososphaerota archaeon]